MVDWEDLILESDEDAIIKIIELMVLDKYEEAKRGAELLLEAMGEREKRAYESHLTNLMLHVMKCKLQPPLRSSWAKSIINAQRAIEKLEKKHPSLKALLHEAWNECLEDAKKDFRAETGQLVPDSFMLTIDDLFEEYIYDPSKVKFTKADLIRIISELDN